MELEQRIQNIIAKHVKTTHLVLVENKIAWKIMLDIVIIGDVEYNDIDFLSYSVRKSLKNCVLPELKINFNNLSSEYNIEVLEETKQMFEDVNLPHVFCFGIAGDNFYFGLDFGEYMSVDSRFVAVCDKDAKVLEFEKLGNIHRSNSFSRWQRNHD